MVRQRRQRFKAIIGTRLVRSVRHRRRHHDRASTSEVHPHGFSSSFTQQARRRWSQTASSATSSSARALRRQGASLRSAPTTRGYGLDAGPRALQPGTCPTMPDPAPATTTTAPDPAVQSVNPVSPTTAREVQNWSWRFPFANACRRLRPRRPSRSWSGSPPTTCIAPRRRTRRRRGRRRCAARLHRIGAASSPPHAHLCRAGA